MARRELQTRSWRASPRPGMACAAPSAGASVYLPDVGEGERYLFYRGVRRSRPLCNARQRVAGEIGRAGESGLGAGRTIDDPPTSGWRRCVRTQRSPSREQGAMTLNKADAGKKSRPETLWTIDFSART